MGKMSERIRTIVCPLSKKRVFRGARFQEIRAPRARDMRCKSIGGGENLGREI